MPRPRACAACAKSTGRSPVSIYARWYPASGESTGYSIKLCDGCSEHFFVPWVLAAYKASFDSDNCPACGQEDPGHWSYTWLTAFAQKSEPLRFTLAVCDSCSMIFRQSFLDNGTRLEDRPNPEVVDGRDRWKQLGIGPLSA